MLECFGLDLFGSLQCLGGDLLGTLRRLGDEVREFGGSDGEVLCSLRGFFSEASGSVPQVHALSQAISFFVLRCSDDWLCSSSSSSCSGNVSDDDLEGADFEAGKIA